jgi:hypothetical protein
MAHQTKPVDLERLKAQLGQLASAPDLGIRRSFE